MAVFNAGLGISNYSTGCGFCDLYAAVMKQAVKDALNGKTEAIEFLDNQWAGWRLAVERHLQSTNALGSEKAG